MFRGLRAPFGADGRIDPEALDVPDRAARLLRVLREHGAPVTKREARKLGAEADPDLDWSMQAVNGWVNDLADAGALIEVGTDDQGAIRYQAVGVS